MALGSFCRGGTSLPAMAVIPGKSVGFGFALRLGGSSLRPVSIEQVPYNLANFLRRLALPQDVKHWSLTTLREKLVKIGAKVTRHAKYVTFQMAEVAVPRRLFAAILDRIARLAIPPPRVT